MRHQCFLAVLRRSLSEQELCPEIQPRLSCAWRAAGHTATALAHPRVWGQESLSESPLGCLRVPGPPRETPMGGWSRPR